MGFTLAVREIADAPYRTAVAADELGICLKGHPNRADRAPQEDLPGTRSVSAGIESPDTPDQPFPSSDVSAETSDPDIDAIEDLGDQIATLAAHIHAATHRLLVMIARFDRLRGWELSGYPTCAHWLAFRTGIDLGAARERVRAARALEQLPQTGAAMSRGELSFAQVRALTRVATSDNEGDLLDLARGTPARHLERMVRAWKKMGRKDEAEWERERHRSRALSVFPDDDGMYVVRGRLMPEVGALLMRAIEAAGDALYREHRVPGLHTDRENQEESAQRRADAIGLLAERAMEIGFGASPRRGRTSAGKAGKSGVGGKDRTDRTDRMDGKHRQDETAGSDRSTCDTGEAHECSCGSRSSAPISGTRAQRYQVVLHVERSTLSVDGEPGRSELEDGTRVSAETSRRLSCDSSVVTDGHGADGSILDVGRRTRTIPPAIRRALEVRDRGCRFPACGLRFTDAHHVEHWIDGGATSLANSVLLCRYHHRLVHEGGWWMEWWGAGRPAFFSPRGEMRVDGRWSAPELPEDPVAALVQENAKGGVRPDAWTAGAEWKREDDIPDEVLFRANEAIE
jgi:hypothetical protein